MRGGIQLQLLIGPIPVPAPRALIEALTSAKVDSGSGSAQSGFELQFDIPLRSPLRALFLGLGGAATTVAPFVRVVLIVMIRGRGEPLIDGMITQIDAEPSESGNARVTLFGKDLSALMDREELPGTPFPALPPSERVRAILNKYLALGVVPTVIPAFIELPPLPLERVPVQRGTDYGYMTELAAEAGHVFFLEPGPLPGTSNAYWGPEIRVGAPQPALTTGMDALNTVDQLSFQFDREHKEIPLVYVQEPFFKRTLSVPIPSVSPLDPPLGLIPPLPPKFVQLTDTAQLPFGEALLRGLAYAAQKGDAVTGSGQLDVTRYGHVLRSRRLVGVRGAGTPYDGLYYVTQVTHEIHRGSYKQSFKLARNGLVSTVPTVPV
ncbi:MAG TPA: hypothetical protein VGQ57_09525 [Polyangiaceae bacterium]|jgi:hypothetical protein|nr:hypothetical protein [Polyangiaceae bacterium]